MRLFVLIIILAFFPVPAMAQSYTVKRLINGDTFELTNGVIVHMVGVRDPKRKKEKHEDSAQEAPSNEPEFGEWIDNILESYLLTPGVQVILRYDVARRDKSGTILAYVYRKRPLDEADYERKGCWSSTFIDGEEYLFINEYLVCSGAGMAVDEPPNLKYANHFKELYANAVKYKTEY